MRKSSRAHPTRGRPLPKLRLKLMESIGLLTTQQSVCRLRVRLLAPPFLLHQLHQLGQLLGHRYGAFGSMACTCTKVYRSRWPNRLTPDGNAVVKSHNRQSCCYEHLGSVEAPSPIQHVDNSSLPRRTTDSLYATVCSSSSFLPQAQLCDGVV
jgi:hypothetical protein